MDIFNHKEMLNFVKKYNEVSSHTCQNGYYQNENK